MRKAVSVGLGVKIRVFILFLLGSVFVFPSMAVIMVGFMEPDITADDTLAMFVMGGLLGFCGLLMWWMGKRMYSKAKHGVLLRNNTDMAAMGMAHMHHISSMDNDFDIDDSSIDDGDYDSDYDSGVE